MTSETGYKVVRADLTDCHSGTVQYEVGAVATVDADPSPTVDCGRGLHAAWTAEAAIGYRGNHWPVRLLRVEGTPIYRGGDKMRCASLLVLEERPVAECFGPHGEGVVNLLNSLGSYRWFAPDGDPSGEIRGLVAAHLERLSPYGSLPLEVRFVGTWDAAWAAARAAAWAAARAAAGDAARAAAWDAAGAAAGDAAWDATWRSVSDLMPGANPWEPLMDIYRLGAWPIGQVGQEFVVFVPGVTP